LTGPTRPSPSASAASATATTPSHPGVARGCADLPWPHRPQRRVPAAYAASVATEAVPGRPAVERRVASYVTLDAQGPRRPTSGSVTLSGTRRRQALPRPPRCCFRLEAPARLSKRFAVASHATRQSVPISGARLAAGARQKVAQHTQNGPPSVASRKNDLQCDTQPRGASRIPSPLGITPTSSTRRDAQGWVKRRDVAHWPLARPDAAPHRSGDAGTEVRLARLRTARRRRTGFESARRTSSTKPLRPT
jgi:hypothetical protein